MEYYYICPFCTNLEQGAVFSHLCKKISANRYKVRFLPGAVGVAGYMEDELYLYGNAGCYEGEEVTVRTSLPQNRFRRTGYCFVGWNTRPDGTGEAFADGQEILNLSEENWQPGSDSGIVTLYACWQPAGSTLQIDPVGGTYLGKKTKTALIGGYGEKQTLQMKDLLAPKGYQVKFEVQGGNPLEPVTSTQSFDGWSKSDSFRGLLKEDTYYFRGEEGHVDLLTATWRKESIVLPEAVREGFLFGGWYYDRKASKFAGKPGDTLTPSKILTLYACWVDLALRAEDNYLVLDGSGAVDLYWNTAPVENSIFRVKQSLDGVNWTLLEATGQESASRYENLELTMKQHDESTVVIPRTGLYRLEATGAGSGRCDTLEVGQGGIVKASFWLQKGETLTISCGAAGVDARAGQEAGNGGATRIVSDQKGLLLEAGGGIAGSIQYHSHEDCEYHSHTAACYTEHRHRDICYEYYVKNTDNDAVERKACGCQVQRNHFTCSRCGNSWTSITYNSLPCREHHFDNTVRYLDLQKCHEPERICELEEREYLHCTLPQGYLCGRQSGEAELVALAGDGSNICSSLASDIAVNKIGGSVEGSARIVELFSGLQGTMELLGAAARDLNPPERPSEETLGYTNLQNRRKRISWEVPGDYGTLYYHQVELYQRDNTLTPKLQSNRTENTLLSGVKGYLVLVDRKTATKVTAKNSTFTANPFWEVDALGEAAKGYYLHIAAVDRADNVSDTLHVALEHFSGQEKEGEDLPVLATEPLKLAEGENIWNAGNRLWYVRADGKTPFRMILAGSSSGQDIVTPVTFGELRCGSNTDITRLRWQIPTPAADVEEATVNPNSVLKTVDAGFPMKQGMHLQVTTKAFGQKLTAEQGLLLEKRQQGNCYEIYPSVGTEYRGETLWSEETEDRRNGLRIIGDGEAPEVFGLTALEGADGEAIRMGKASLHLWAEDSLSGLQSLRLHVLNRDNTCEETFEADADGHLRLSGNPELPLWCGRLVLTVEASDRVGNCFTREIVLSGLELAVKVERVLKPVEPVFKGGEAGILFITVTGEVNRIEVEFPKEMTDLDTGLNRVILYPEAKPGAEEEVPFFVPLYTPGGKSYPINVKAYSPDGTCSTGTAILFVLNQEGGMLSELRTRLR